MSDIIYKIFPRYYYPKYTDDQIKRAAGMLKLTSNGRITFTNYKSVQFIIVVQLSRQKSKLFIMN